MSLSTHRGYQLLRKKLKKKNLLNYAKKYGQLKHHWIGSGINSNRIVAARTCHRVDYVRGKKHLKLPKSVANYFSLRAVYRKIYPSATGSPEELFSFWPKYMYAFRVPTWVNHLLVESRHKQACIFKTEDYCYKVLCGLLLCLMKVLTNRKEQC